MVASALLLKMAASSKIGGYQCEFVGTVSEDFLCGLCKHVAREPHLTSCCGMTVCKVCISPVIEDKKSCPSCEKAEVVTFLNVRDNQRILALEVRCIMKDRGCEWTSKLEGLKAHLDVNTGDCEYVDIECPNRCDQQVEKRNLPTHLTDYCPKREFTCQYCNFKATYEVVSNDHWPQCPFYPVPCPNACGIQAVERGDLEAHLLQCPLEELECDFSHAGCNTKLPRQDLERHMEESLQKHLVLMSNMSLKFEQKLQEQQETFQQKLQEQQDGFRAYLEQKEKEMTEKHQQALEEKIKDVEEQLSKKTHEKEAKIRDLQQQLWQYTGFQFKMPNFKQHKDKKDWWYSPPLYTHSGGYKFCIEVEANGRQRTSAHGTHVTVNLYSMQGEFDSGLRWPAKCTITLQLLNQERDQDHVTVTETFAWNMETTAMHYIAYFGRSGKFVAHTELEYNHQNRTRYLKNDDLLFRIIKVKLN